MADQRFTDRVTITAVEPPSGTRKKWKYVAAGGQHPAYYQQGAAPTVSPGGVYDIEYTRWEPPNNPGAVIANVTHATPVVTPAAAPPVAPLLAPHPTPQQAATAKVRLSDGALLDPTIGPALTELVSGWMSWDVEERAAIPLGLLVRNFLDATLSDDGRAPF